MAVMTSPYKLATDSPSRQLLWELSQLAISNQQRFYDHLDHENEEREIEHRKALNQAAAEHDAVRRSAEQFREQLELQIRAERQRKEEEVQKELDRQRRENQALEEAAKKREIERAKTAELEAQRAEEARRADAEAVEKRKREKELRDAEVARRLRAEQDKQAQQKQQAAAQAAQVQKVTVTAQEPKSTTTALLGPQLRPDAPTSTNTEHEVEHARYLEIHKNLKELRRFMNNQARQTPELKTAMGEMRREIKKSVGQIREGKGRDPAGKPYNTQQKKAIIDIIQKASTVTEPTIDITMFLASPPAQLTSTNCPALLLYLLNIFSKAIIAQLIDEASVKPQIADNLGTVVSHVFAIDPLRWQGISLIDILISKYHKVCPVLFGIHGDEQSAAGKDRLGWWREEPNGPFIPQQQHSGRMTGLGAGFAAISLRNYEKATATNPYPEYHYWKSLARIINTPPNRITQTHFVVLKAMIEGYEDRFLLFYGDAAKAALRHALIELPKRSPQSVASKALAGLVDVQRREQKLVLGDGV